jgi:hypothetical protein
MAALQILAALDPEDEAALAAFDHKYWGVVAFTRDRRQIEEAMAEIEPFGATALHDALARAASDLASHGEGRRAVVVLTDGVDTASQLVADEVLSRSQALDVPIYAVSVVSPLDDPRSDRFTGRERPAVATAAATVRRARRDGCRCGSRHRALLRDVAGVGWQRDHCVDHRIWLAAGGSRARRFDRDDRGHAAVGRHVLLCRRRGRRR